MNGNPGNLISDALGRDLDRQAVWREIRAVLRFEQCYCMYWS